VLISNGASIHNQNNTLKVVIVFAKFLGPDTAFHDLKKRANNTIVRYKRKPLE
jgi:hypothetical protein